MMMFSSLLFLIQLLPPTICFLLISLGQFRTLALKLWFTRAIETGELGNYHYIGKLGNIGVCNLYGLGIFDINGKLGKNWFIIINLVMLVVGT